MWYSLLMRKDLDETLCRDFPLLYRDRRAPMAQTAVCWGFPGNGWEPLIRKLSAQLEALIRTLPEDKRGHYCASQVKEKFGALRFYMTAETDHMRECIADAEEASTRICETCGEPGETRNERGWLRTSCGEHSRPG